MFFSVSRNFYMRASIEAIPVAPGSSQKVEQKTTGASLGVFGASSGVLVTPNQETLHFVRVCVLIFYVLFRGPQLWDASSDRGDSAVAGKLSKNVV